MKRKRWKKLSNKQINNSQKNRIKNKIKILFYLTNKKRNSGKIVRNV